MQKVKIFMFYSDFLYKEERLKAQARLEKFINNHKIINFDSMSDGSRIMYTVIYEELEREAL